MSKPRNDETQRYAHWEIEYGRTMNFWMEARRTMAICRVELKKWLGRGSGVDALGVNKKAKSRIQIHVWHIRRAGTRYMIAERQPGRLRLPLLTHCNPVLIAGGIAWQKL
jgi:hypothetical protein